MKEGRKKQARLNKQQGKATQHIANRAAFGGRGTGGISPDPWPPLKSWDIVFIGTPKLLCPPVYKILFLPPFNSILNAALLPCPTYFLLALALGPQLASGFSGNRDNFSSRDGGLASLRTVKDASILHIHVCVCTIVIHVHIIIPKVLS